MLPKKEIRREVWKRNRKTSDVEKRRKEKGGERKEKGGETGLRKNLRGRSIHSSFDTVHFIACFGQTSA